MLFRVVERKWWYFLASALIIVPGTIVARERFVLMVTAIQLAFYIGSYFATPHAVAWHVVTSWSRLTDQIAVPITFAVFLMLAEVIRRGEDARHAEARPDE